MWSLGVILYILLSGSPPFGEDTLFDQIRTASYNFQGTEWEGVSDQAKDLIRHLLTESPINRLQAEEVSTTCLKLTPCKAFVCLPTLYLLHPVFVCRSLRRSVIHGSIQMVRRLCSHESVVVTLAPLLLHNTTAWGGSHSSSHKWRGIERLPVGNVKAPRSPLVAFSFQLSEEGRRAEQAGRPILV